MSCSFATKICVRSWATRLLSGACAPSGIPVARGLGSMIGVVQCCLQKEVGSQSNRAQSFPKARDGMSCSYRGTYVVLELVIFAVAAVFAWLGQATYAGIPARSGGGFHCAGICCVDSGGTLCHQRCAWHARLRRVDGVPLMCCFERKIHLTGADKLSGGPPRMCK